MMANFRRALVDQLALHVSQAEASTTMLTKQKTDVEGSGVATGSVSLKVTGT
jgi:hypothetical protein